MTLLVWEVQIKNNGILKELTPKKIFAIIAAFLLGQALFGGIIYSVSNTHKIVTLQIKNEKTAEERYRNIQKTADERYRNLLSLLAKIDEKNKIRIENLDLKIINLKSEVNEKFLRVEERIGRIEDDIRIIKKAIVKKHPDLAQELISKKEDMNKTPKDKFSGMGGSDEE